jgi:hypothetical protein
MEQRNLKQARYCAFWPYSGFAYRVRIDVIKEVEISEVGLEGVFSYLAGKVVALRYVVGLSI